MESKRQIWKFPVDLGPNALRMPRGARPVSLGAQGDQLVCWAEVDPNAAPEYHQVLVVGTGQTLEPSWQYVGTVQADPWVWHLYWEPK